VRVGDKSVFAATSGPDSEAGSPAPLTFGHLRRNLSSVKDNALFVRRCTAQPCDDSEYRDLWHPAQHPLVIVS